ncbi:phage portal protein [Vagococcus salmoninarum]|uniref:phage portal protein n=1 Tax=Vagococcus salmoninarum TaxID=2739 RepID=UPI001D143C4C|nr:phage portal protein [Vagococcus salmoninarum]
MGILNFFKKDKQQAQRVSGYQMVVDQGNGFYAWNGDLYQSDIVKSAMRPKVQAIGKAMAKHIRKGEGTNLKVNPEPYIRFLLEEPNEIMSMQMLLEKMANQLELNGNAFALIIRDSNGLPAAIYPIVANQVEMVKSDQGILLIRFSSVNGKIYLFKYSDVIHLRKDYNNNEYFGDSLAPSLAPLMEIVTTTDQGIVKAIKNSNVIRWLLKFNQVLRPEDIEKNTKAFVKSFLDTESDNTGAAGIDSKTDAQQVDPKDYVPNEKQMQATTERIYSLFNTNDKIVQSKYSENEWISYYESQVEPVLMQLTSQFTIKIFSRRERGFGNSIMFESSALTFASMKTKLGLVALVDRGVLSRNEMRGYFNLAPVDGGDAMVLRLDTGVVRDGKGGDEIDEED